MRWPPLIDKLVVTVHSNLVSTLRYRSYAAFQLATVILELSSFYLLTRAIGTGFRPEGLAYFPFLFVGTGLYTFLLIGTQAFVDTIRNAQLTGTMEVLMTTSTSGSEILSLNAISAFLGRLFYLFLHLGLGVMLFGIRLHHARLGPALLIFLLSWLLAVSIGLAVAAVQVAVQRGASILWSLGSAGSVVSGIIYPASSLPQWLRNVANWTPMTHAVSGMRVSLFGAGSQFSLTFSIGLLAGYTLLMVPLSLWLVAWSLRYARRNGLLSAY